MELSLTNADIARAIKQQQAHLVRFGDARHLIHGALEQFLDIQKLASPARYPVNQLHPLHFTRKLLDLLLRLPEKRRILNVERDLMGNIAQEVDVAQVVLARGVALHRQHPEALA